MLEKMIADIEIERKQIRAELAAEMDANAINKIDVPGCGSVSFVAGSDYMKIDSNTAAAALIALNREVPMICVSNKPSVRVYLNK